MAKRVALTVLLCAMLIGILIVPVFAHSGGTDADGGHYDSSTGQYHYHCGGHPAHQHRYGVCPYEGNNSYENDEEAGGGGLLYSALVAGTAGAIVCGVIMLIKRAKNKNKGKKKQGADGQISKTNEPKLMQSTKKDIVPAPLMTAGDKLYLEMNKTRKLNEEKEQELLLQQKQKGEQKDTELSDNEKLKLVGILDDALLYAEELGQKEMLQKYFIDFSCDALNYLVPNELEEFDVKAFALFYISGAYFVLRKLYIDAHPEAKDVDDMHEIKEFEELKLLVIAAIIAFPPKENEKLSKYAAMVIALSQADDETEYNYILNEFGRGTAKATYINEWLNRVMFFIKNATATFETIKKNKYTELDFLVYFMFTNYTIFCTAKKQKSAEEYSKITFHWFMENIPSEYELDLEFAEEFYWNRTEAYNKVMMSNSDMKEAALAQTYQQFISKDNTNEPFEKCLVIGNFMEKFNYSVEASNLISTINKSLSEYFKKICDEFE